MNIFKRLVVIVVLLSALAGSAIILFLLVNSPETFIASLQAYLDSVLRVMTNTSQANRLAFGLGLGGIIWLCVGSLLWLMLRRPANSTLNVRDRANQKVAIDSGLVAQRLIFSLHRLADVQRVEPTIQAKRGKITVDLKMAVEPSVSIPMKTREIEAMTRELIEDQMGLQAAAINVLVEQGQVAKV